MPVNVEKSGGFVAENAQAGVKQYPLLIEPGKTAKETLDALVASAQQKMANHAKL
jgi:hypothetical protein